MSNTIYSAICLISVISSIGVVNYKYGGGATALCIIACIGSMIGALLTK